MRNTVEAPRKRGRYRIHRTLAEGGMGVVQLASLEGAHGFERRVAIKTIRRQSKSDAFVRMFLDEAWIASQIHHPNVCQILDFGEDDDGTLYIVMEHLDGRPLDAILAQHGRLPPAVLGRIIVDAARGLHAAHQLTSPAGERLHVIHRDVSPHNIFVLNSGHTKILDFGIAKARSRLQATTRGQIKGKIAYSGPERFEDDEPDLRTDLWSLGVVFWQGLAGQRLFDARGDAKLLSQILSQPIRAPSEAVAELTDAFDAIVLHALQRDPRDRPPSAAAFADAVEAALDRLGQPSSHSAVTRFLSETATRADVGRPRAVSGIRGPSVAAWWAPLGGPGSSLPPSAAPDAPTLLPSTSTPLPPSASTSETTSTPPPTRASTGTPPHPSDARPPLERPGPSSRAPTAGTLLNSRVVVAVLAAGALLFVLVMGATIALLHWGIPRHPGQVPAGAPLTIGAPTVSDAPTLTRTVAK